jgi:sulfate transport system substrate-binding protein
VDRKSTRKAASAYLEFLFSPTGQDIIARHHNRVHDAAVAKKYAGEFPAVRLVSVDEVFGGWDAVMKTHFADGGLLDQALLKAPAR